MSVVSNLLVPIENQRPEKTLRFLLLSESRRTLPHPHNRLVVGSSPTGPTTYLMQASLFLWGKSPLPRIGGPIARR
jgi:hypothetical protein